jgi:hypothetical protein
MPDYMDGNQIGQKNPSLEEWKKKKCYCLEVYKTEKEMTKS